MEIQKKELMKQKKKKKSKYGVRGTKDEGEKNRQIKLVINNMMTENRYFPIFLAITLIQASLHITTKHVFLGNLPQCISLILRRSYLESRNQLFGLAFKVTVNVNALPLQLLFCSLWVKLSTSDRPCVLQALLLPGSKS